MYSTRYCIFNILNDYLFVQVGQPASISLMCARPSGWPRVAPPRHVAKSREVPLPPSEMPGPCRPPDRERHYPCEREARTRSAARMYFQCFLSQRLGPLSLQPQARSLGSQNTRTCI